MVNTKAGETAQKTLRRPLQAGPLSATSGFTGRASRLLICDPSEASPEVREVLHAAPRALAVHADEHALCLALGSHLSAAVRLYGRSDATRTGERFRRPESAR